MITQGALIRRALQQDLAMSDALDILEQVTATDRREFWMAALHKDVAELVPTS